jgi:hypothetical protein
MQGNVITAQATPIKTTNNTINGGLGLPPSQTESDHTKLGTSDKKDGQYLTNEEKHQYHLQCKKRRAEKTHEALTEWSVPKTWDG